MDASEDAWIVTGVHLQDYLVLGSDSGKFTVLEYVKEKNKLEAVQMETFGKSGCRRIVPGQYLAVDPKGRAAMIGCVRLSWCLHRPEEPAKSPASYQNSTALVAPACTRSA